ncbi:MAG TPA: UDP-N-acetyl-D-mannosamine dehydrogenase [Rhodospirillales bacterium]
MNAKQAGPAIKRLCVIGLGYVGLPTAAIFAGRGVAVTGVDTNRDIVDKVNRGEIHIVEPNLDKLVQTAVADGRLRAATAPEPADAFVIAVPTPFAADHKPDLTYVMAAADSLKNVLKKGDLIVVESTVPVGTTEAVSARLATLLPGLSFPHETGDEADVNIAHSPERVLPGHVVAEITRNDRVIGGISRRCGERAAALYRQAVEGECLITTARTAELVKLAENAYRDVNIAFANELSLVADRLGIDVWEVVRLANHHPRVNVLKPGPGVGGHCIAVDPWFIVDSAPDETPLIQAARRVNDAKPRILARRVAAAAKGINKGIEDPVIACLGLAYKADIDDLRESPAITVVRELAKAKAGRIVAVEPHVNALPASLEGLKNVALASLDAALKDADVVVLLTDHKPFRELDRKRLEGKVVFDARGAWR